jgi:hypothetical protein
MRDEMPVVNFKRIAIHIQQAGPVVALGDGRGLVERRPRMLIGHLEKEQERELLDVVSIREPVNQATIFAVQP